MKKIVILFSFLIVSLISFGQNVRIKNDVFEVLYSQSLEQPLIIKYRSINRPTNVNRGAMDFYKEPTIKTCFTLQMDIRQIRKARRQNFRYTFRIRKHSNSMPRLRV